MNHEPRLTMIQSTGALRFYHPCSVCGAEASRGTGCALLRYMRQKESGMAPDKKLLGDWRCEKHRVPQ
jgi:hypothetical protein